MYLLDKNKDIQNKIKFILYILQIIFSIKNRLLQLYLEMKN